MSTRPVASEVSQTSPNARILRIDSTSIVDGGGNDRLSAQAGNVFARPSERSILCSTDTATGSISIYLPDALQCIGDTVSVYAVSIANSTTITVKDVAGNSLAPVLSVTDDHVVLLSNGVGWLLITDYTYPV